jgi:lipid II:glycine glycyltransferase (peptidoglycan interpeptide bridge formation enzyme)
MRWHATRLVKYDLWGVRMLSKLKKFTTRFDGLWGVYRFKRGFGGELRRAAGPWDRVYLPRMYRIYSMLFERTSNRETGH